VRRASDAEPAARALPIARDLIQFARAVHIVACSRDFLARDATQLSRRLPIAYSQRAYRQLLKTVTPSRPIGALIFNIRISTEDEINGTVKWVV
jgi:hypothetical protein